MGDEDQGIIHVIGPQLGLTQPGMVIVCGDSHTATHGAFGSIAFGIGTSEVEHVLATQTIWQTKPKTMGIHIHGQLPKGVYAKDIIMGLIAREGVSFGTGYAAEFYGDTVERMSMEERMTLSNMAIEGGASRYHSTLIKRPLITWLDGNMHPRIWIKPLNIGNSITRMMNQPLTGWWTLMSVIWHHSFHGGPIPAWRYRWINRFQKSKTLTIRKHTTMWALNQAKRRRKFQSNLLSLAPALTVGYPT